LPARLTRLHVNKPEAIYLDFRVRIRLQRHQFLGLLQLQCFQLHRDRIQPPQSTPVSQVNPGPETPKVGGKWTHPALLGIENEARKAMFGEEELKRLVLNTSLLYAMWWISAKVEESDIFESVVRFVRHSPKLALGLQIISWTFRGLFLFNILRSILPLLRPKSRPLTTIPLTPAQRELIGLDNADITPIATIADTITPPRYKASPSGTRSSPRLTASPRSVSLGTPTSAQKQFTSSPSSLGTFSTPVQPRPRSSSGLAGRKFASGVGGSPLGLGGSPLGSGTGGFDSPTSRKASMEVFFRG